MKYLPFKELIIWKLSMKKGTHNLEIEHENTYLIKELIIWKLIFFSSCSLAPPLSSRSYLGAHSCQRCQAGHYQSNRGSTQCEECPQGSYANKPGAAYCKNCTEGTFSK